jgi:PPOX class probable FMN-dependent enzyme
MRDRDDSTDLLDQPALRHIIGEPTRSSANKEMPSLDELCRQFLSLSTILFISTVGRDGKADVSPRGDPAGFIKVLDDRTIAIPDRPGNRRVDTMSNILDNPGASVGLVFLVPGVDEMMRASGRARVSSDPALLAGMAVGGKMPKLAIVIALDEVFFHCGKALKRARIWDPAAQIERRAFASYAQIIQTQRRSDEPIEKIEKLIADNYRDELY